MTWEIDMCHEPASLEERQHWFLIAQGAISNALRHSGAKAIRLSLAADADGRLSLCVKDDGQGFDPERLEIKPRSGFANMQWHARRLGAGFRIDSAPGQGVVVYLVADCLFVHII